MKYFVYTDGSSSHEKGTASSAYLILTEDKYISSGTYKFEDSVNSNISELNAILIGARAVSKIVNEDDIIIFITDSKSSLNLVNLMIKSDYSYSLATDLELEVQSVLKNISDKVKKLSIMKVRAHKKDVNSPNRIVDLLARKESR